MFNFISRLCKSNKTIEYPFNKNYRNGYKKLWIDSLHYDYP